MHGPWPKLTSSRASPSARRQRRRYCNGASAANADSDSMLLPTIFASQSLFLPHAQLDRRTVLAHVAHSSALLASLPALADGGAQPSAKLSFDDLLEDMAADQSKRSCTSAIKCPSEQKKASAVQGGVGRSKSSSTSPPSISKTAAASSSLQPGSSAGAKK